MKLHIIQFVGGKGNYLNDACVFSASSLDDKTSDALREAQEIIESQWLANYTPQAYCVLLVPKELAEVGTQLFDKVRLIHQKDWETVIEKSEGVLINSHLFSLLRSEEDTFLTGIVNFTTEKLLSLFEDNMLVVAGIS